jgi:hypothetical protein
MWRAMWRLNDLFASIPAHRAMWSPHPLKVLRETAGLSQASIASLTGIFEGILVAGRKTISAGPERRGRWKRAATLVNLQIFEFYRYRIPGRSASTCSI